MILLAKKYPKWSGRNRKHDDITSWTWRDAIAAF
jgi:hypothetical protein